MSISDPDRDEDRYGPLPDATPLEIAERLEEMGYPNQAARVRSGEDMEILAAADWLRTEAGYVKRRPEMAALLSYAQALDQAVTLRRSFELPSAGEPDLDLG